MRLEIGINCVLDLFGSTGERVSGKEMSKRTDARGGGVGKAGGQEWYLSFSSKIMDELLHDIFRLREEAISSRFLSTNEFSMGLIFDSVEKEE